MIRLDAQEYAKAEEPLREVTINTLFAQAVIHGHISGEVYTDDLHNPAAFYIVHPYGMSLLFGETDRESFRHKLVEHVENTNKTRQKSEWLQVHPRSWDSLIRSVMGPDSAVQEENTRVNFAFDRSRYEQAVKKYGKSDYEIVPTTREIFRELEGGVAPKHFWRDSEQFAERGIGYTLMDGSEAASTSFAAFLEDNQLEIGIETSEKFRGKGYAFHVCSALIDYCLEANLEPVWSCRQENEGSYYLAQKLGFIPTVRVPYYRLEV
ncbi:GNAT acetyltransferase [Paenibacillus sophorae]|uniref:GNAT acetyltransferase n=1 Tax=Paenibacillus sophorae TaxID=1333845 RepID=A0A1H8U4L2_9BACL|nr:GNAT family N-acetyltransferase [Paenibacillus sophorae]QWU17946.1 GNAT family N-acetyltransferase [Paenibacillus sophorae]SEO98210.1 GNAT acetyltransferase [Paenibacillus sophorae]